MDIVIIAASPRDAAQSKSVVFSAALAEGISQAGASSRIFLLSDRTQWHAAEEAFLHGTNVLFVLPIFCGGLSGTFIEFTERLARSLPAFSETGTPRNISFLVHGGLPGGNDFRFCARYLKTLPAMLDSVFSGVIGFSDTTYIELMETRKREILQKLYVSAEEYVRNGGRFSLPVAFWGPEDMPETQGNAYCRLANRFYRHLSLALGCEVGLDHRPYSETD